MPKHDKVDRRQVLITGGAAGAGLVLGSVFPGIALSEAQAAKKKGRPEPKGAPAGEKPQSLPQRVLGKTGEKIPILLFGGAVKLDPTFDPKLAEALRYGVNYIDTADCYNGGRGEAAVGNFLERTQARKQVWLTSKSDKHSPEGFAKTLANSLKTLKTDQIDLYFLHALKDKRYLSGELQKLVETLKKQGKIRYFGFSCHHDNVAELLGAAADTPWVDAVMFRYNFRQYGNKALNAAIDRCVKAKVGLIAMKVQGSEASFRGRWEPFRKTGKWNKYQAVLKAVWADERITAAVSHMDTLEKLRENVAAARDPRGLKRAEWEAIEHYARMTRAHACDGCDHLCGADLPHSLRIGDTLRYLMYHDAYGEPEKARRLYAALPPEARQLSGLDLSRAASSCPHGLDLPRHLARAAKVLA